MHASLPPPRQQARFLEHAQVAGDGRKGDVEGLREIADGGFARGQARQDRPARRVRQGGERCIERLQMVNQ